MKTIIQLLIVALVLNAAFQTARAYYTYYDYRDSLVEEANHGRVASVSQLHQRAVDLGAEYGLDVAWEDVKVRLDVGQTVVIDFAYVEPIPFVPKYYVRPWTFSGSVSAFRPRPLLQDER
jgi:hypothetical protein